MTQKIGIMGDSHGQAETIAKAAALLQSLGCGTLLHLGDICDSARPETADACVAALQRDGILAVKGNNDHAVVVNHEGWDAGIVSTATLKFLKALPNILSLHGAVFAHSSPFVEQLGLSALVRDMGPLEMRSFFFHHPQGIFFRGHSHSPQICWSHGKALEEKPIRPGDRIELSGFLPCVITCGSLTRSLCMAWDTDAGALDALSFS